ncbi:Glycosyl hydrolases family 43 [Butyrivibrio sp. INlla18]|uniref:family 43 glycosylhydrolase n=1 Tax=Butyrivibrio sp. INlla18 TaxID=1520806 RepID=UPI0008803A61|nr:family 43 glycosylhydrolase [Butyrivibrio sp. INlla18]SDA38878.1 Glycosyl hydrolases family 43 [Butyrivibrio sp. INlla18]
MKNKVMNPYLPLYEYIPDGEPRIFGDRLYVYGSHDYAGGELGFCPGDYMVYSTSVSDLSAWRCDGVAFSRKDCPLLDMEPGKDAMAAPDVVQGVDGRYYMYFNLNKQLCCQIAVSDKPEGPFLYYGEVVKQDGTRYEDFKMFDPGVLVDDGRVYLFTGFNMPGPVPEKFKNHFPPLPESSLGFELATDMKTIIRGPVSIIQGSNKAMGTSFEGHGYYEASSPRKINGKYVMVYSSELSHELAYAVSNAPLGVYEYKGVLVSNGDFGINGNKEQVMPYGNTHGGLVELDGRWYVFYHRQTHGIECSRQGCAEQLPILEDGWFGQAEITSCGLNQEPLPADGTYNACYCCYLTSPHISKKRLNIRECRRDTEPHIYEEKISDDESKSLHYIANMKDEVIVGFKYFEFREPSGFSLRLRGTGAVRVKAIIDEPEGQIVGRGEICLRGSDWNELYIVADKVSGTHALYFVFESQEPVQFESFTILND